MEFSVAHMANLLKTRKQAQRTTALFLGAKAGGLFRSLQLYNTLRFFGPKDLYSLPLLERYRQCYDILCGPFFVTQDINDILEDKALLKEIRAEIPELCIAELTKQGVFNPILSVSIYGEFEEAFQQIGMRELEEFVVVRPKRGAGMSRIHTEKRDTCTLIKVFGGIASRDYNVNRRARHLGENEGLKEVVTGLHDVNILIVGADQIWDRHIIHALFPHSDNSSVWYVNDEEPPKNSTLSEYLRDCKAQFILGVDGHYENFFRSLCWHMTGTVPPYQAAVEEGKKEPEENQDTIQKLANEVGSLRGEVRGLRSELRQFFRSAFGSEPS